MGEDIHQRTYLKLKENGKYVNAFEFVDSDSKYGVGAMFVDGRNYEVFSLFGSRRGSYAELPYAEYGLPSFLDNGPFQSYCRECGYYGFIWYTAETMLKAVREYRERLKRPDLYIKFMKERGRDGMDLLLNETAYDRMLQAFSPGFKTEEDMAFIGEACDMWFQRHSAVMEFLRDAENQLSYVAEADSDNTLMSRTFDMGKTIYLFFFDS